MPGVLDRPAAVTRPAHGTLELRGRSQPWPAAPPPPRRRPCPRAHPVIEVLLVALAFAASFAWGGPVAVSTPAPLPSVDPVDALGGGASSPCYPEPASLAAAPLTMQALWAGHGITTIPSCSEIALPGSLPALRDRRPQGARRTSARVLEASFVRGLVLVNWALRDGERGAIGHIANTAAVTAPVSGSVTFTPGCDLPAAVTLVDVPAAAAASMSGGLVTAATTAFVQTYRGPCQQLDHLEGGGTVMDPAGSLGAGATQTSVVLGVLKRDRVLGRFVFQQSVTVCPAGAPATRTDACALAAA